MSESMLISVEKKLNEIKIMRSQTKTGLSLCIWFLIVIKCLMKLILTYIFI